ncbi:MAG: hypothetical protein MK097_07990 [Dechloromonas sp.]|nr:hypothetical protein [Dechloromonas sp.]
MKDDGQRRECAQRQKKRRLNHSANTEKNKWRIVASDVLQASRPSHKQVCFSYLCHRQLQTSNSQTPTGVNKVSTTGHQGGAMAALMDPERRRSRRGGVSKAARMADRKPARPIFWSAVPLVTHKLFPQRFHERRHGKTTGGAAGVLEKYGAEKNPRPAIAGRGFVSCRPVCTGPGIRREPP